MLVGTSGSCGPRAARTSPTAYVNPPPRVAGPRCQLLEPCLTGHMCAASRCAAAPSRLCANLSGGWGWQPAVPLLWMELHGHDALNRGGEHPWWHAEVPGTFGQLRARGSLSQGLGPRCVLVGTALAVPLRKKPGFCSAALCHFALAFSFLFCRLPRRKTLGGEGES